MPESTNSAQLTLALALSPWRERPELLSRLAPLNPLAAGARDVPARSGSECNRRLGEGSGRSRLSEPLRPGTGRAPKEDSWEARSNSLTAWMRFGLLCLNPDCVYHRHKGFGDGTGQQRADLFGQRDGLV